MLIVNIIVDLIFVFPQSHSQFRLILFTFHID